MQKTAKEEEKNTDRTKTTIKQNANFNPKYISNYIKLNWAESSS